VIHEPINVESLQRAILIWETARDLYRENMAQIKRDHKVTWFLRPSYWKNERYYHKSFTAIIRRRIQLQTAIKSQKES
jgi:hypothetical protein